MSKIIAFYRDGEAGAGRTFEQIMALDDLALEYGHDWVQWVFPLPEPSRAQPQSPVMSAEDLEMFKTDDAVRNQVFNAFDRWMDFLENTTQWLRRRDHNHLRITRVIRFLTLIDMPEEAEQLYHTACGMMVHRGEGLPDTTKSYWSEALKEHPAWLG